MDPRFAYDPNLDTTPGFQQQQPPPPGPGRMRQYGQALLNGGLPGMLTQAMGGAPQDPQKRRQYGGLMGQVAGKLMGMGG